MIAVFSTVNYLEAEEVRTFLRAYGIESVIVGLPEDRSAAFAPGKGTQSPIRVMVLDEAAEEAGALLRSLPEWGV